MLLPKNKPMKVPITRKGPKGIWLLIPFFLKIIKIIPIIAPIKKAKKSATMLLLGPKNKPIKNESLTSPNPIHLPEDTNQSKKKKNEQIKAAAKKCKISVAE